MIKFNPNIFAVSNSYRDRMKVTEIGNAKSRLVEIDGFFERPDDVRAFLLQLPIQDATTKRSTGTFFPGYQTFIKYEIPALESFYKELSREVFGFNPLGLVYSYQCIDGNKPVHKQSCLPHADPMCFASNVFLNYEEEIGENSGTAFYRSRHTNNEIRPAKKSPYRVDRDYGHKPPNLGITRFTPIIYNDDWQQYHVSLQKFNKMNMYEGALYHSAFIKFNTFTQTPRLSFVAGDVFD